MRELVWHFTMWSWAFFPHYHVMDGRRRFGSFSIALSKGKMLPLLSKELPTLPVTYRCLLPQTRTPTTLFAIKLVSGPVRDSSQTKQQKSDSCWVVNTQSKPWFIRWIYKSMISVNENRCSFLDFIEVKHHKKSYPCLLSSDCMRTDIILDETRLEIDRWILIVFLCSISYPNSWVI